MNRENLRKIAKDLCAQNFTTKFDMQLYNAKIGDDGLLESVSLQEHECGTVACVVGSMPQFGFPAFRNEDWAGYSWRVTGIMPGSVEWIWLFSGAWHKTDNTPQGAAARINWLLDHGLPDNHYEQMCGIAPLCYRDPA